MSERSLSDTERSRLIRIPSVHTVPNVIRPRARVPEWYGVTPSDMVRDGRVTTQVTTQTSRHPSGEACATDCPYPALTSGMRESHRLGHVAPQPK